MFGDSSTKIKIDGQNLKFKSSLAQATGRRNGCLLQHQAFRAAVVKVHCRLVQLWQSSPPRTIFWSLQKFQVLHGSGVHVVDSHATLVSLFCLDALAIRTRHANRIPTSVNHLWHTSCTLPAVLQKSAGKQDSICSLSDSDYTLPS